MLTDKIPEQLLYDILLVLALILIFVGLSGFLKEDINSNQKYNSLVYRIGDYSLDYQGLETTVKKEDDTNYVQFEIPEGSTTLEVAYLLEKNNIISVSGFLRFVDLFSIEKRIKAGEYHIQENVNPGELFSKILIE